MVAMRHLITMAQTTDLDYGCSIRDQWLNPIWGHFQDLVSALESGRLIHKEDAMKSSGKPKVSQVIPGPGMVRPQHRQAAQGIPDAGPDMAMKRGGAVKKAPPKMRRK